MTKAKTKTATRKNPPKVGDELWFIRSMYSEADQLARCVVERVEVDNSGNAILSLAMTRRSQCWCGVRLEFPMTGRLFTSFTDAKDALVKRAEDRLARAKAEVRAARKELAAVEDEVATWVCSTLRNGGAR